MRLMATGANSGGRFTVGEQVTPVGWGPPRHIHSPEDEIFYILEGTYEMHVGDERRTLSAGACAIMPRNVPHGFRNVASTPSIKNYHVVANRVRRGNLRTSFILRLARKTALVEAARERGCWCRAAARSQWQSFRSQAERVRAC